MKEPARPNENTTDNAGGESVCWLDRVCADCGALGDDENGLSCPRCGAAMPRAE